MSAFLALLGAVCYGLSDFLGGYFSRRTSAWSLALVASLTGAVLVLAASAFVDGDPTGTDLLWGLVAGAGNGFGTAFLYRGLAGGRMGVVAPISAVGAAVVPVVAGLAGGERPGSLVWLGIAAALPGIWLVSREPDSAASPASGGVLDGVLAGLGFGSLFAALGQIPDAAGLLPLGLNQLVAAAFIVGLATLMRSPWLPRDRAAAMGVTSGVLGASATAAFLVATQLGSLTVSAVLASLYPAFTILLAATILREPVHRAQAVGLMLCGAAVALVAGG